MALEDALDEFEGTRLVEFDGPFVEWEAGRA